jgi:hypothetical protein
MERIMKRPILAFIVGLLAWIIVVSLIDRLLRLALAGYAAAEPKLTFTLGMMAARLGMAALTSLIAGAVVGAIAPGSRRTSWALGAVLLAIFIPIHINLWHALPVWYHLTFLVTLAPLIALGAWAATRRSAERETVHAAANESS